MTDLKISAPVFEPPQQLPNAEVKALHRQQVLEDLLGTDYQHAQDTGLIDAFYVDPVSGEDGLLHILGGDVVVSTQGAIAQGFHHEPSARDSKTFVDRAHLAEANKEHRKLYREFPYEPYAARVVIDGMAKQSIKRHENGETELIPSHSNMFPKEYDALTVMKSIVEARDTRDTELDKEVVDLVDPNRQVIVTEGRAPLLDGEQTMRLRLILDKETSKVMSAFPLERKKSGFMNLSKDAALRYLGL